jgi:O-antigen/teichoic acid export membrane protein
MVEPQNRTFITHAAIYGLGTLLVQAASIVLLPLYTRCLTVADFGILEILSRTGQILNIVLMANGIATATFTFYCQAPTPEKKQNTAATVTLFLAIILAGGTLIVAALARPLALLIGVDSPALAAAGILAALAECTTVIPMCLAQARVESIYYVSVSLAMLVCRVLLVTAAVAVLGWGIWGVLLASIVTSLLFAVVLNLREFWHNAFRPELGQLWELARFALPFVPGGLCLFVLNSGDRFFLVKAAGAEELGIYALGCKLAMAVGIFSFMPLFKVWSARMYDAFALPNAARVVGQAFTRILGAYLLVGLALCLFAKDAIVLLATPAYIPAAVLVGPLCLGSFFASAANLADGVFYAHRRTGLKPWIALASMLVMCALYAWLIPAYGAMGAAAAVALGFFFHATATWAVSQRVFRVQYEYSRLAGMLFTAAAIVVLAGRLNLGMLTIPAKVILWIAWPALLWIAGLVSREEKTTLLDGLSRVSTYLRFPWTSPADGIKVPTPSSRE